MEILEIKQVNDALAEMVALFRVELRSYKGIASKPNIEAGREEMEEYLSLVLYCALLRKLLYLAVFAPTKNIVSTLKL